MGRPKLPASQKKSRHASFKMTIEEERQLVELGRLAPEQLKGLLPTPRTARSLKPARAARSDASSRPQTTRVILMLVQWVYQRLRAARRETEIEEAIRLPSTRPSASTKGHAPSTGKSLRTHDAAQKLGLDDGRFLVLARRIGLVPRREKHHFCWSEADVARLRDCLESDAG
jgi:hypothetical protein